MRIIFQKATLFGCAAIILFTTTQTFAGEKVIALGGGEDPTMTAYRRDSKSGISSYILEIGPQGIHSKRWVVSAYKNDDQTAIRQSYRYHYGERTAPITEAEAKLIMEIIDFLLLGQKDTYIQIDPPKGDPRGKSGTVFFEEDLPEIR